MKAEDLGDDNQELVLMDEGRRENRRRWCHSQATGTLPLPPSSKEGDSTKGR